MAILKKIKLFDWIGLILMLSTGYFLDLTIPDLELLPRFGALCVIVALFIAGFNSRSPIYENYDGMAISKLPSINASDEVLQKYKAAEIERKSSAELARDALFVRVPLWAGIGTLVWGFGDLIS